jgi:asparagine synthase (glutamine-hydrolysing)
MRIARSLPATELIKNGWSKFALRKALNKSLPASISWRRDKKGFSVPEGDWLMQSSAYWVQIIRSKIDLDQSRLINKEQLLMDLNTIFADPQKQMQQNFAFKYACYLLWLETFHLEQFA